MHPECPHVIFALVMWVLKLFKTLLLFVRPLLCPNVSICSFWKVAFCFPVFIWFSSVFTKNHLSIHHETNTSLFCKEITLSPSWKKCHLYFIVEILIKHLRCILVRRFFYFLLLTPLYVHKKEQILIQTPNWSQQLPSVGLKICFSCSFTISQSGQSHLKEGVNEF